MKDKESRIPRSNNRTERYQDKKEKDKRCSELANYYYQFIKDFATIARLLHNIVKKKQK